MADSAINGFSVQKTDTPNGSYFGFDWWDGTNFQTVKILSEDLAAALSKNFANANLTATGNRSHDFNEFNLLIGKIKELKFETTIAPSTGEPAIQLKGFGNTASDEILNLTCTAGDILQLFGDKSAKFNGKVVVGTPLASNYTLEVNNSSIAGGGVFVASGVAVNGYSPTGLGGQFEGVSGITAFSSTGNAVTGKAQSGGLGGKFEGGAYVETYGFGGSAEASAVFEVASTTKGALIPRMTTTQRDAISSPATGLEIFNTTTNRKEYYNGTYWAGEKQIINIFHGSNWNPNNAQSVVFSGTTLVPQVAPYSGAMQFKLRGAGVIRSCTLNTIATSVAGTAEPWSLYIRINSTDYLVATVATTRIKLFENLSLNIPYVDGDLFQMVFVNPTWATRPQRVVSHGTVTIE